MSERIDLEKLKRDVNTLKTFLKDKSESDVLIYTFLIQDIRNKEGITDLTEIIEIAKIAYKDLSENEKSKIIEYQNNLLKGL